MRVFIGGLILFISACSSTPPLPGQQRFEQLDFLLGEWVGKAPDGSEFYEAYSFDSQYQIRSTRYKDRAFSVAGDSSIIRLEQGEVISVWNDFSWKASDITDNRACFVPLEAPSSFCWEKTDSDHLRVTQKWTDQQGVPQQYTIDLVRK
ncbi:hypothetical protein [Neptunicella marina]|uniref:Uncharacterized protein n=1 Tax=Neptunicella marina TaxID=2125989 RepID=A0A8J6IXL1_9ALTE|nr:hypothetical protein [Neptunicella marina]MBC3767083.1 hypothetical protein [Neptunicella marina]